MAGRLLNSVIYISERETKRILLHQNQVLMDVLAKAGLSSKKLIYVSVDEAGSSSPVMLSILRNGAGLEQRGCKLLDSRDVLGIRDATSSLEEGAIVYVDDFVGSGDQLCTSRTSALQGVIGNFSEFLLVPCICEEGFKRLNALGVTVYAGHIHAKAERPLHEHSHVFDPPTKTRLIEICKGIRPKFGLGYQNMATMVVLYRNAPNGIPAVLRGSDKCRPFMGLFPRYRDLPVKK
jgi:hypothetical protein